MLNLGLRQKLVGMSLLISAVVLGALAIFDDQADQAMVLALKSSAEDLTEAVQVSVQQLGPTNTPDEALLRDYARRLGRTGMRSIRVLRPDRTPFGVGTPKAFFIEEEGELGGRLKWDLLVPVVIGADKLGYVELKMTSANFEAVLSKVRWERTEVTATAFALGLLLTLILARRISRPLEALRGAARNVAAGQLDVPLPTASGDEVGELVTGFKEMLGGLKDREVLRHRLEAVEREALLGRMATSIAHDVRNPLNYLSLSIDHLLAQHPSPESGKIGEQMKAELARANARISEFLRLGKPVEVRPQSLELGGWLAALAEGTSTPDHSVTLRIAGPLQVEWDPTVVEGILRNLVTNAIQASPNGGPIELEVSDLGQRLAIEVRDRGSGFELEALPQLFEPWFTTKATGVGLGLALAKRAALEHGGDLTARARDGGGAIFTLTLPKLGGTNK